MDNTTKSILQMARGAITERADYEMARIIGNIMDANTKATAKRKLTSRWSWYRTTSAAISRSA